MIKDSIKMFLIVLLLLTLFINKRKVSRERYNSIAFIVLSLFAITSVYDLFISLLIISIGFILFSKMNIKESFNDDQNKKPNNEKIVKKDDAKKDDAKKEVAKKDEKVIEKQDALPKHCSNIKNLDDEFLKEYDIDKKKLDDIQNNIFDKYNYDVFYNEQGEGASDIQGILNHEVIGFEKL